MFPGISRVSPSARLLPLAKPSKSNVRCAVNHCHSIKPNCFNRQDFVAAIGRRLNKSLGPSWHKHFKGGVQKVSNKVLEAVFFALTDLLGDLELVKGTKEQLRTAGAQGKIPRGEVAIKRIATIEKAPNYHNSVHPITGERCPPKRPGRLNVYFADEIMERAFPGWKRPEKEKAKPRARTLLGT